MQVESERAALLRHPIVLKLLEHKWDKYGQTLFYASFAFHVVFIILLTAFALVLLHPLSPTCMSLLLYYVAVLLCYMYYVPEYHTCVCVCANHRYG